MTTDILALKAFVVLYLFNTYTPQNLNLLAVSGLASYFVGCRRICLIQLRRPNPFALEINTYHALLYFFLSLMAAWLPSFRLGHLD